MEKVFVYTDRNVNKLKKTCINTIKKIHGEKTEITISKKPSIQGKFTHVLMRHLMLINEKTEEGYQCYLELDDKRLLNALFKEGVSFGVVLPPHTVKNGRVYKVEFHEANHSVEIPNRLTASFTQKKMTDSKGFLNRGLQRPVGKNLTRKK
jgi:hypothetical protein